MTTYPKRLIEVDLPIKRISAHARREKSIRHGHISTLHIWWARRPLAACRAVICAALWPDPADPDCPPAFRVAATEAVNSFAQAAMSDKTLGETASELSMGRWNALTKVPLEAGNPDHWNVLRRALLDFIADFANWDNSTSEPYLTTSRALTQAAHEALGGQPGTRPLVVDPFAGGGAIPLEALRVGADAFASDLNPVAVLLNKVVLEYIPKYGQELADEVRKWGAWIKEQAEQELAAFYPPDPDGATPIAYLWARTITCEGPGCGTEVPLIRSLWLAKRKKGSVALRLLPDAQRKQIDFDIIVQNGKQWVSQGDPSVVTSKPEFDGTVRRGSATCPVCGYTTPVESVRAQLKARSGGTADARMFAVVTTRPDETGRFYRLPTERDLTANQAAAEELERRKAEHTGPLSLVPDESTSQYSSFVNRGPIYGMSIWEDYFSSRQCLALASLSQQISGVASVVEFHESRLSQALQTCLALAVGRQVDYTSSLAIWSESGEFIAHTFGRQALPFVWDFAEVNPFGNASGDWLGAIEWIARVCAREGILRASPASAQAEQINASEHTLPDASAHMLCTDPPYYYSVQYADLSDFFFVWLKRTLAKSHSSLFDAELTPKKDEIIVQSPGDQYASEGKNRVFYENRMKLAMSQARRVLKPSGVGVVVFAHTSTDGWESMLDAMLKAGWTVTGSWPIDTERSSRLLAVNRSVLASSIHLVCRPRETPSGELDVSSVGDWRDVLQELPERIHAWLPRLAQEGVVGADALFACLGPALEIFSRYSRVERANGEVVSLSEYLEQVWAAVSKEALDMVFQDADTTGFEEDARLTAAWLWTLSTDTDEETGGNGKPVTSKGYTLEYDAARKIAQGLGVHLEQLPNLVEVKGSNARLLPVAERTQALFGKGGIDNNDRRQTAKADGPKQLSWLESLPAEEAAAWAAPDPSDAVFDGDQTTLDRVHQSMLLFAAGKSDALRRFLVDEGVGQEERFWRLAQALSALYPSQTDEKRWVDGVLARKKGLGF